MQAFKYLSVILHNSIFLLWEKKKKIQITDKVLQSCNGLNG